MLSQIMGIPIHHTHTYAKEQVAKCIYHYCFLLKKRWNKYKVLDVALEK